jgi:hypothetical protein
VFELPADTAGDVVDEETELAGIFRHLKSHTYRNLAGQNPNADIVLPIVEKYIVTKCLEKVVVADSGKATGEQRLFDRKSLSRLPILCVALVWFDHDKVVLHTRGEQTSVLPPVLEHVYGLETHESADSGLIGKIPDEPPKVVRIVSQLGGNPIEILQGHAGYAVTARNDRVGRRHADDKASDARALWNGERYPATSHLLTWLQLLEAAGRSGEIGSRSVKRRDDFYRHEGLLCHTHEDGGPSRPRSNDLRAHGKAQSPETASNHVAGSRKEIVLQLGVSSHSNPREFQTGMVQRGAAL